MAPLAQLVNINAQPTLADEAMTDNTLTLRIKFAGRLRNLADNFDIQVCICTSINTTV